LDIHHPRVYRAKDPAFGEDVLLFHYDMLYERYSRFVQPGWYVLQLRDPALAPQVAAVVDSMFKNSSDPTKTGTERAFNANFVTMWGNVSFLMNSIGMAVVFAILLVAANSMMLSARERTNEVGILKTVGFSDRLLFGLVMAEASTIALVGAVLGSVGQGAVPPVGLQRDGFPAGLRRHDRDAGDGLRNRRAPRPDERLVPAWNAARLSAVQALRHVE